jgi:hypothetical protein
MIGSAEGLLVSTDWRSQGRWVCCCAPSKPGLLGSIRPTLEKLQVTTMWLSEDLVHSILVEAQEQEDTPPRA